MLCAVAIGVVEILEVRSRILVAVHAWLGRKRADSAVVVERGGLVAVHGRLAEVHEQRVDVALVLALLRGPLLPQLLIQRSTQSGQPLLAVRHALLMRSGLLV